MTFNDKQISLLPADTNTYESLHTSIASLKARYIKNLPKALHAPHSFVGLSRQDFYLFKDIIEHGLNVEYYARMLFEGLAPMHSLNERWRTLLFLAAQYHDVGTIDSEKAHHKHSYLRIKLDKTLDLPENITEDEREIIALIARYHRRALPCEKHAEYAKLDDNTKNLLCQAASILRLADALDYRHRGHIKKVSVNILEKQIILDCLTDKCISLEKVRVEKKGDLFRRTFHKDIECKLM